MIMQDLYVSHLYLIKYATVQTSIRWQPQPSIKILIQMATGSPFCPSTKSFSSNQAAATSAICLTGKNILKVSK